MNSLALEPRAETLGEQSASTHGLGPSSSNATPFELDLRIVRDMLTPDRAIDLFLDDGERQGWSQRTLSTYRRILDEFADRLPIAYDINDVQEDDIRRYLGSKKGRARGTIAHTESVLASFFRWCFFNRKIKKNPMDLIQRTRRIPSAELNVVTISSSDVEKLLDAAAALDLSASTPGREVWSHRVCLGVLCYMGPRRRAVARLRLRDYNRVTGHLRFDEKGGKSISKPVPDELRETLDAMIDSRANAKPTDFLVPPAPHAVYKQTVLDGSEERDDRCVWDIVKSCGSKAGVNVHVHALRAAFAVFYLEQNPGDVEGLRELLGHRSITTTAIYLRRLNTAQAMERVRGLSWRSKPLSEPLTEQVTLAKSRAGSDRSVVRVDP